VVLVVARLVVVRGLDAVVLAAAVLIDVVVVLRARPAARAGGLAGHRARLALDRRRVPVGGQLVAVGVAGAAGLRVVEIDAWQIVDEAVAVVVGVTADLDPAVRRHAGRAARRAARRPAHPAAEEAAPLAAAPGRVARAVAHAGAVAVALGSAVAVV